MSAENPDINCERLSCKEEPRPMSVHDALRSLWTTHGDYIFMRKEAEDDREMKYLKLSNVETAIKEGECLLRPCKLVNGQIVVSDGPGVRESIFEEVFDAVLLIKKCPNGAELGREVRHAVNRTITGQGIVEKIKLAYLV